MKKENKTSIKMSWRVINIRNYLTVVNNFAEGYCSLLGDFSNENVCLCVRYIRDVHLCRKLMVVV